MAYTFWHSLVIAFLIGVDYKSEDLQKMLIDCEQFFLHHITKQLQFIGLLHGRRKGGLGMLEHPQLLSKGCLAPPF